LGILGILRIENRKPKIVNCKFYLFPAGNNYQKKIKKIKNASARTVDCVRRGGREGAGREGGSGEGGRERGGREGGRGEGGRGEGGELVRTDAHCFIPGNLKKDATVRPSHEHRRGHRLTVRPSVRKGPRDNPA
jgi:hypothetical protein